MNHASLNLLHNLVTDVSQMLEHHPTMSLFTEQNELKLAISNVVRGRI